MVLRKEMVESPICRPKVREIRWGGGQGKHKPKSAKTAKVKFFTADEDKGAEVKVNSLLNPPSESPAI
jgi:hypothetical protein